jgi:flagellar motor switch protein FliN/FliY
MPPQPAGQAGGCASQTLPLEALHDVELDVEVVLGRARLPLRALLVARPRTTIELDRAVRSAVDVMVNGTLFARGEMVVVDDAQIGVQITEVVGATMAPGA